MFDITISDVKLQNFKSLKLLFMSLFWTVNQNAYTKNDSL